MMTREEFERTVKKMQDEGVSLSMANLLVRTELPRAQIEQWLDGMQRDVKIQVKPAPKRAADDGEDGDHDDGGDGDGASGRGSKGGGGSIGNRAKALRDEFAGDALKSKLGIGSKDKAAQGKHSIKQGAVLGLAVPPAGLLYSAPWKTGAAGTAAYAALAYLALMFPMIGIPYILIPLHLAGGVLGAGYAWRYNRKGRRAPLLPAGETDDAKKKKK